jgi:hypothetical protein
MRLAMSIDWTAFIVNRTQLSLSYKPFILGLHFTSLQLSSTLLSTLFWPVAMMMLILSMKKFSHSFQEKLRSFSVLIGNSMGVPQGVMGTTHTPTP